MTMPPDDVRCSWQLDRARGDETGPIRCPLPRADGLEVCQLHKRKRCAVCGEQATHNCTVPVEANSGCGDVLCWRADCIRAHAAEHVADADWPDELRPRVEYYLEHYLPGVCNADE